MSLERPRLQARKPSGAVPWPLLLVEGEEKSGKSWAAALLSTSPKVGATYWLDLGEGAADEYAAIPGTRYLVLEHDGTYAQVLEQVLAVKAEAARAQAAGEPPTVLVIDSASDVWDGLKDWVSLRAREKPSNQRKLAADPAAELDVSRNLWNDAAGRYRRLMTVLLTFPGIVVLTARGKVISATDPSTGQPYRDGRKTYAVEGHKSLPFDATLWLRMSRTEAPVVVGARSVHAGIKPGQDDPQPITAEPANLLEWLVFDVLKCDPTAAHVRDLQGLTGGDLTADERAEDPDARPSEPPRPATDPVWRQGWEDHVSAATTVEQLRELWLDLGRARREGQCAVDTAEALGEVWKARSAKVSQPQVAADPAASADWPKVAEVPA